VSDKLKARYRKTVLPNGLRIVSEELPHVRSVTIGVWLSVGSRDETATNNGISHFIEHMVFKGTKHRTLREIGQSIESVGGYLNAFTSKEHTCFYARVLDEHADLALDVLSDILLHPTFPEREVEKERGVIIEELKNAEDDPDDIIHDYFEKAIFGPHSLGFPVIGTEENLRRISRSELVAYRRQQYTTRRMIVAAAGNLSHGRLVELTERYFSRASAHREVSPRVKPRPRTGITLEIPKPIQQAHVCIGKSVFGVGSKHRYTLLVLNALLGEGMSSRLFQNIREKYGFAYSVYSYVNLMSDVGSFVVYVGTDRQHIEASTELILNELEKLTRKPIPKAELDRTRAQLKGSMMLGLESMSNRMMRLGTSELYFGELSSLDSIVRQIDAVGREDIQELAHSTFHLEDFSKVVFIPNGTHAGHLDTLAREAALR
jgi:predicted Zn-dependent peptidase